MWLGRESNNKQIPGEDCRRLFGRRKQECLTTNLGEVINISRGGMQIRRKRQLEGSQTVVIDSSTGKLTIQAKVVWSKRIGRRLWEIGLEFGEMNEATIRQLTRLSTAHAPSRSIMWP